MDTGSAAAGLASIGTKRSAYNENPVVSRVTDPSGREMFVAVFDTVDSEHYGFGLSTSLDGLCGPSQPPAPTVAVVKAQGVGLGAGTGRVVLTWPCPEAAARRSASWTRA